VIRTYRYFLRPNKQQEQSLGFLLWQSRNLYNAALEQRINIYRETQKGINYPAQWAYFKDVRNANPETYGRLNATSVQQLLRRLDKSFSSFFRRLKMGETAGFPRYKGRNRFKSFEFTYGDGCKLRQGNNGLFSFYVQNVGEMKMCYHRAIPPGAVIKHVVIKVMNNRWYACLMLDLPDHPTPSRANHRAIGIDVGLKSLLAFSDGILVENPHWLRECQAKLRVLQRKASRRVKGSNRRRKAYEQVAGLYEHITNQRNDFLHKVTKSLVDEYTLIGVEDLTLAFMNRNRNLSLSSHDAGFGEFRQLLLYKAENAGTLVIAVNPAYTSQICSNCGAIVQKDLSVRVHKCDCGLVIDRDVNAAINILALASKAWTEPSGHNVGGCAVRVLRSHSL
jgi:putative transposase